MSADEFLWHPSEQVRREANWTAFIAACDLQNYEELDARSRREPEWFWNAVIRHLDIRFTRPYERVLDLAKGLAHARWCIGGQTNFVLNALDRHLPSRKNHPAVVWEGESQGVREWTYGELELQVDRLANGLVSLGLKRGDVVAIYMPQIPETVSAFLACAKLGCIAMPLFSGFGKDAVAARLRDAQAAAVITTVSTSRRGKPVALKEVIDEALQDIPDVRSVVVAGEPVDTVAMHAGRDVWMANFTDATKRQSLSLDAEHPILLVFTSGTSGKPKGTVHTHCGFTAKAALDYQLCWDMKASDRFHRFTDFGWFAGPMMLAGTLLSGATLVLTEGVPDYPTSDRLWRIVERQRITFLGLAPTLARSLRSQGGDSVDERDLSSLRAVGSSGESWDVESWTWVFRRVCKQRIPLMNYCGGTEMGGLLSTNVLYPMKPGAFNGPIPGTGADVVDTRGKPVADGEVGELVMRGASIGTTRGLWREPERYLESYWSAIPGIWSQGDMAMRDADGAWFVLGRSDDTIKIAGKRTGPSEIEQALLATELVAEAAAVGMPDAVKGSALVCVVVTARGVQPSSELAVQLGGAVAQACGAAFRPKAVLFTGDLPKTRNLKVMRRVVRDVLAGREAGDLSALINPQIVEEIRRAAAENKELTR